METGN